MHLKVHSNALSCHCLELLTDPDLSMLVRVVSNTGWIIVGWLVGMNLTTPPILRLSNLRRGT